MQTRLVDLVLNVLRKAQYQVSTQSADELYLVTDDYGVTSADVTNALGYIPYNSSNPSGYVTSASLGDGRITLAQDDDEYSFTVNQVANAYIPIRGLYDYYTLNGIRTIGSPFVENGEVSNFSSSNYVIHNHQFPASWELDMKFTTDYVPSENDDSPQYIIGDGYNPPHLAIRIDGHGTGMVEDRISVCVNGTWYGLQDANLLSHETIHLVLSTYAQSDGVHSVGTHLYVYSETASELVYDGLVTSNVLPPTTLGQYDQIYFGYSNGGYPLDGSVNLSSTYLYDIDTNNGGAKTLVWRGATPTIDNKADVNLSNLTDQGKILMSAMGMPSDVYDDLTLGASGATYTAPADGWFTFNKKTTAADQYGNLVNETNGMNTTLSFPTSNSNIRVYLPVKRGDVVKCSYSAAGSLVWFRFVYAKGSESEGA